MWVGFCAQIVTPPRRSEIGGGPSHIPNSFSLPPLSLFKPRSSLSFPPHHILIKRVQFSSLPSFSFSDVWQLRLWEREEWRRRWRRLMWCGHRCKGNLLPHQKRNCAGTVCTTAEEEQTDINSLARKKFCSQNLLKLSAIQRQLCNLISLALTDSAFSAYTAN